MLPRKRLSQALGRLSRVRAPRPVLRPLMQVYCQAYGVDLSECQVPDAGFGSFDEFFTRQLLPGARTIDQDPATLVSPADGRIQSAGPVDEDSRLWVKGREYTAAELLGDPALARTMAGGTFAIVYLSPRDYHRVHAPADGPVVGMRHVPGTLLPVNEMGFENFPKLFARNERVVFHQRSERFGSVASIMVGAIGVGRISVTFDDAIMTNDGRQPLVRDYGASGPQLRRGDEMGVFHLGSTVIVFVPADSGSTIVARVGEPIRLGDALLRAGTR